MFGHSGDEGLEPTSYHVISSPNPHVGPSDFHELQAKSIFSIRVKYKIFLKIGEAPGKFTENFSITATTRYLQVTMEYEAAVAQRLACSPPNMANRVKSPAGSLPDFRKWKTCQDDAAFRRVFSGMSLVPPISLTLHCTDARSPQTPLPLITLIATLRARLHGDSSYHDSSYYEISLTEPRRFPPPRVSLREARAMTRKLSKITLEILVAEGQECTNPDMLSETRGGSSLEAHGAPSAAERCLVASTGNEFSLAHSGTFHTPLRYSRHLLNLPEPRATVAERLDWSLPTKANRVQPPAGSLRSFASRNRARRCSWSAGFLGNLPFPPPLHFGTAVYSPHFTFIGSQDLAVKIRPNLFTHLSSFQHKNGKIDTPPSFRQIAKPLVTVGKKKKHFPAVTFVPASPEAQHARFRLGRGMCVFCRVFDFSRQSSVVNHGGCTRLAEHINIAAGTTAKVFIACAEYHGGWRERCSFVFGTPEIVGGGLDARGTPIPDIVLALGFSQGRRAASETQGNVPGPPRGQSENGYSTTKGTATQSRLWALIYSVVKSAPCPSSSGVGWPANSLRVVGSRPGPSAADPQFTATTAEKKKSAVMPRRETEVPKDNPRAPAMAAHFTQKRKPMFNFTWNRTRFAEGEGEPLQSHTITQIVVISLRESFLAKLVF
ncbi:hypothetical protein PR048_019430 [Dryococelus australis]|uniref:Uncharacterized protein n=1 Tax=Dryococelus australis TaxID=614101 RepID=A0ABQ9H3S6_9NEOP|nr:hypothetical protein PR048_019430 [Dryococelus australis]